MSLIVKDAKWKEIQKQIKLAQNVRTRVGIHEDKKTEDGDSIAEYATYNEFGATIARGETTYTIPERSFFRSTIAETKAERRALTLKVYKAILHGNLSALQGIGLIGEFMKDKIKDKIVTLIDPKNADSTIKKKKSSNPLIDSGSMLNSVTHVEDNNG